MKPNHHHHAHTVRSDNERKTSFVVIFSAVTMILEIVCGLSTNSMALLADGIHMGSHVLAIGLSWGTYVLARHLERREGNTTDTDKLLKLAAYTSGIMLLVFALFIIAEAVERLTSPAIRIRYNEAMTVAVIGIVVNLICAFVLHDKNHGKDYNRHSAYLHVVADALTSVGAIIGLLCAKIWDITWVDTAMAVVFSIVIVRWARRLLLDTGKQLVEK